MRQEDQWLAGLQTQITSTIAIPLQMGVRTMPTITQSQMRAFTGEHLAEAAFHWEAAADKHEGVFGVVHSEAQGLAWQGQNREATVQTIGDDYRTVQQNSDKLRAAAQIARTQASTLLMMAHYVTHFIDQITEGGEYTVD